MKKIKVLVSGVGGDVAQGIIKALESSALNIDIYKTCISSTSSWLYKDEKSYIVPLSSSSQYIPTLLSIINKYNIDVFIPAVDSEIPVLFRAKRSRFLPDLPGQIEARCGFRHPRGSNPRQPPIRIVFEHSDLKSPPRTSELHCTGQGFHQTSLDEHRDVSQPLLNTVDERT